MPARVPQIEVTFDIDANGILNVSAQEKGTGAKQAITISGSGNLNRDEIDRMVREAEMNADSDRQTQELIELKNKAESLAYQTEKALKELGDKVDEATRQSVTEKVDALRNALKGEDQEAIQTAFSALESESHSLSEKLYANVSQAADASEQEGGAATAANDDVIDAEFKEEK